VLLFLPSSVYRLLSYGPVLSIRSAKQNGKRVFAEFAQKKENSLRCSTLISRASQEDGTLMPDKQTDLVDKPLHPNAVNLARESVDNYAASLIVLAKTLAFQRG